MRKATKTTRRYIELVVNQGHDSVDSIASILNRNDINKVSREIQSVIDGGFLPGFRLDPDTRMISRAVREAIPVAVAAAAAVPGAQTRQVAFTCKACGANNNLTAVEGQPVCCEYCDTAATV